MMVQTLVAADNYTQPFNFSCRSIFDTPQDTFISLVLHCCMTLTVTLNSLVIISISHFRQLHTPTNFILLSLAVSDLLVGITVMPIAFIVWQYCKIMDVFSCVFMLTASFILTSASIGTMVLISVDRYMAICVPLRYSSVITSHRVKICVFLCWSCSIIYNCPLAMIVISQVGFLGFWKQQCKFSLDRMLGLLDFCVTFLSPVTVIIILYVRVFLAAVKQARLVTSKISAESNTVTVKKSELRAAKTLGIIVFVFILTLFPYYSAVGTEGLNAEVEIWIFLSNSLFNPLIYGFFYPWFRKSVKIIFTLKILQPGSRDTQLLHI